MDEAEEDEKVDELREEAVEFEDDIDDESSCATAAARREL